MTLTFDLPSMHEDDMGIMVENQTLHVLSLSNPVDSDSSLLPCIYIDAIP